ncbi:MAG: ribosome recycling factor [Xanthomonadales bacterium]|nr:ribosome recycling factor [Xanthomonadales bacterium]
MINDIIKDAKTRMGKSIETLRQTLAKVRTGRAHPSLLEHVTVEYYGSEVPLSQVSNIIVEDARMLSLIPWEKSMVGPIEKAIMKSDLGLNPATSGTNIRIPLPALTEERRRELGKVVHNDGENCKIAIRNIRRDANHHIKDLLKSKDISEDEERRAETQVQAVTDEFVAQVDKIVSVKEKELLEI